MSTNTSRSLTFEVLQDLALVVSYQPAANPSDVEWDRYISAADALVETTGEIRLLAVTEGGHPTRSQVQRFNAEKGESEANGGYGARPPRVAIVSSSAALRFVASVMSFANPRIRCFSPAELDAAYRYLGLEPDSQARVAAAVERLRAQISSSTSAA